MKFYAGVGFATILLCTLACAADKDDDDDAPKSATDGLLLTADQQRAAGIVVAHPVNASAPSRIGALGVVLDPSDAIEDTGNADAADAAARAATAELSRAQGLYAAGAGASLKAVQAAQADEAHARTQAQAARAKLTSRWRPLVSMNADARQKLLTALTSGATLLVRADLPGRHVLGEVPQKAQITADGVEVEGHTLGVLAHGAADAQGASVLIEVDNPPTGLGPGARIPVALLGTPRSGVAFARDAVLYDDSGAYVYKRLKKIAGDANDRYAAIRVQLIQRYGDGWLGTGIDDDDDIVVHGAGVLWSLQGLSGKSAGDDGDD